MPICCTIKRAGVSDRIYCLPLILRRADTTRTNTMFIYNNRLYILYLCGINYCYIVFYNIVIRSRDYQDTLHFPRYFSWRQHFVLKGVSMSD